MVFTPHPGEAASLLGTTSAEVQADRYAAARKLSEQFGAVVVLKGASSIVYDKGRGAVNLSGNPFMATAGSGDVLSGVIAALLAQGHAPFDAARIGVYVHGRAGDLAHEETHGPITASDLAWMVAAACGELYRGP
jgi:NAD(P)H-hydrate epimerase